MLSPEKTLDLQKLYTVKIWRLLVSFCIWSWFYSIVFPNGHNGFGDGLINHPIHLWFLPVIIGLYIVLPALHKIAADRNLVFYLIGIGFLFSFCLPMLHCLLPSIHCTKILEKSYLLYLSPIIYFMTGYVLATVNFSAKARKIIYLLGCISLLLLIAYSEQMSLRQNMLKEAHGTLLPMVFLYSIAVFVWIKELCKNQSAFFEQHSRKISAVARLTFGIYLSHVCFINMWKEYIVNTPFPFAHTVLSILFSCVIFVASAMLTA